jgi:hypothetical protein
LRARKEAKTKPYKAQVGDIALVAKPAEKKVKAAVVGEQGDLEEIALQQGTPTVRFADANETAEETQITGTPTTPVAAPKQKTPRRTKTPTKYTTPPEVPSITANITPPADYPGLKRTSRKNTALKQAEVKEKGDALMHILLENPEKFNVTKNNQIINPNTKKPVEKSNLTMSVHSLIEPGSVLGSPPGMKFLKKAVAADERARELVHPSYLQSGRGRGIIGKEHLFRPSLWRK